MPDIHQHIIAYVTRISPPALAVIAAFALLLRSARSTPLITDCAHVARNVDHGEFDEYDFVIVGGGAHLPLPSTPLHHPRPPQAPPGVSSPPVFLSAKTYASSLSRLAKGTSHPSPSPTSSRRSPQRKNHHGEQNACRIFKALPWSTRLQPLHRAAATCRQQEKVLASWYVSRLSLSRLSAHSY